MVGHLSTAQKLSLAGMFIGAIMCLVGLTAPYWIVTDINFNTIQAPDKLAGINMGVFMICGHTLNREECRVFDADDDSWIYVVRMSGGVCVLIGGICGLVALSLTCSGRGTRFVALGVSCFLAAAIGCTAPALFAVNFGDAITTKVLDSHLAVYGWAFYMYCAGVVLLGVVSVIAFFSAPENPIGGMVLSHAGPSVIVTQTTQNRYLPLEHPSSGTFMTATAAPGVTVVNSSSVY